MPIAIDGSGTITGVSAGGLPDASIVTADIADANVTAAKLSGAQTGTAPIYGCRAWVNFDGTRNEADTGTSTNGANVKIRASGNVSSVLKNAVGDYTVTFTTAMVDANYTACICSGNGAGSGTGSWTAPYSVPSAITSSFRIGAFSNAGSVQDQDQVMCAIFR